MENFIWVKIAPNKQNIGLFFSTRNGITKNKNPLARFLKPCPRVWFSFCKSKAFGKIWRLLILKFFSFSPAGMDFSRLLFFVSITCSAALLDAKEGRPAQKPHPTSQLTERNPQARPYGLKINWLEKNQDCDSTADKVSRLSPKLSF